MRIGRTIFAVLISLALVCSLAPAGPVMANKTSPAKCCHDAGAKHDTPRSCDGGPCSMQCCRLIPCPSDAVPPLEGEARVTLPVVLIPPATLESLADPDAIFHPPRA
ncbi:MAG: hypothetical protein ABIP55_12425 [Tepidisphaeraceae bacterium]